MTKENQILEFANLLADEAKEITLSFYERNLNIENKSKDSFDPVTSADKEAEALIRNLIMKKFPDHGIIGEEFEDHNIDNKPYWVIDPIDGTRAFILNIPVWGTLLAYNDGERPILGLVDLPILQDRYIGFESNSYKVSNGKKAQIFTSKVKALEDATISTTDPMLFSDDDARIFNGIISAVSRRRFGLDCTGYCLLALGKIDVVMESDLKIYDIQAIIPIIEGAGGVITDWEGNNPNYGGNILASANKELHSLILQKIKDEN